MWKSPSFLAPAAAALALAVTVSPLALAQTKKSDSAPKTATVRPAKTDAAKAGVKRKFNIGREAKPEEIAGWDIDVRPDGQGLPEGKGSVQEGEEVYMARCAVCHGEFGEGVGRWPHIAGGNGSLASDDPNKTVGSYFPYLSTLFDYVRHAMPFGDAQSLTNDELYAVTAYILNLNDIVDNKFVLTKESFKTIKMPNAGGFFDDDRETTERVFWNPNPCMRNCKPEPAQIISRARILDVTPDDDKTRGGPNVD